MGPIIGVTCPWSAETWGPNAKGCTYDYAGRAYGDAISRAGGVPLLIPTVLDERDMGVYAAQLLEVLDGLYFTGGGDRTLTSDKPLPLYAQQPGRSRWEEVLMKLAYQRDIPCLGVCRGYQMMAVAFGGTMDSVRWPDHKQTEPYHIGIHDINPQGLLADLVGRETWCVNSIHVERVKTIPEGFCEAARTQNGTIEAIYAMDKAFFLGTQFHPELMLEDPRSQSIFRRFIKVAESKKRSAKK